MAVKKYEKKYCQQLLDFFDVKETYQQVVKSRQYYPVTKTNPTPTIKSETFEIVANPPPFFEEFARNVGIRTETLLSWAKSHYEFGVAMEKAKEMRKQIIVGNGLTGLYDSKYCQFASKNMEEVAWKDETVQVVTDTTDNINLAWQKRKKTLESKNVKTKIEKPVTGDISITAN